ncbi:MAG: aldehyde dehydrogenase [Betaproteobacteria bacterium]|nr:aldehyde dehydrogenase [Betaproteobacteria bacterium]MDE2124615.1 aldehyde dehydrogenase [Betaproteobacteria bacterium]MDE2187389.1 aldehyde dehydrogenase [Betaproteobacteria bacterium]MDE2324528.1 aldehyde dehydrogenase [Betaproteobacteria bacterium]
MSQVDALTRYELYIDGASVVPDGGEYFASQDPFTGKDWAMIARGSAVDVDRAVRAARRAFESAAWSALSASRRGALMRRLADLIGENASRLAEIERRDNGKLAAEVVTQVNYMSEYFHYYAGLADKVQGSVIPTDKPGVLSFTRHEPKGVVAIITPWNSPLTLTSWKLAPALAAGCTVVIKPSEFTSASMLEFARLFAQAGFPPGVVNVVTGLGPEVGAPLVAHPDVAHIGFTGGEIAGQKIYEAAARGLKTVTLELGGKSPNIVFDDADLDRALLGVVSGIFAAAGQTCQAGSRLLVQRSVHDEFVRRLVDFVRGIRLGDPADPGTQIGPIATPAQFDKVLSYIEIAKAEGARCVTGGRSRPDIGSGQFVEPTIFVGVDNRMRIAQEEVFGPVLSVIAFDDEADAVRIANDVQFGLAAGVWTQSLQRALYVVERVKAGTIWVNNYRATSYTSPFGGFKRSGIGRESGIDAIREYLETKCVWLSPGLDVANPFVRR